MFMKKLIGLVFIIALVGGMSCTPDVTVNPTTTIIVADTVVVDPDILKFAKFMKATWRCTKTSFTSNYDWIETVNINCSTERQFAFLKAMKITGTNHYDVLKVENTYFCSSDTVTTFFHLE